jgi:hypothetical protein
MITPGWAGVMSPPSMFVMLAMRQTHPIAIASTALRTLAVRPLRSRVKPSATARMTDARIASLRRMITAVRIFWSSR